MKQIHFRSAVLALAAGTAAAMAQPGAIAADGSVRVETHSFLAQTLVSGQNERVLIGLLRPAENDSRKLPPGPCKGQVRFFDAQGEAVGEPQDFALLPGQSTSIAAPAVQRTAALGDGSVRHLRAVVLLPAVQTSRDGKTQLCAGIAAQQEVFSTDTLETKFISPAAIRGFDPQPEPPTAQ